MVRAASYDKKISFSDNLIRLGADSEHIQWVGNRGIRRAWEECPNADWLLWFVEKIIGRYGVTRNAVELATCACAETVLKNVPVGEERPRLAIEATRRDIAERSEESKAARLFAEEAALEAMNGIEKFSERAAAHAARVTAKTSFYWCAAQAAALSAADVEVPEFGKAREAAKNRALKSMADIVRSIIKPDFSLKK